MAYMSQEKKAEIAPAVKALLKQYGLKGSLSVRHHSTLVLTIKSGAIDFLAARSTSETYRASCDSHVDVNVYHIDGHWVDGPAKDFLKAVYAAMDNGNHDNSDLMTDYHDVGWYVEINIGKWDVPYVVTP